MLTVTLPLLTRWALSTWANLTMDEIVYHLSAELGGVDANILRSLALTVLLPAIIAGTAALFFCRRKPLRMLLMSTALLLISTFSSFSWFNHQLDFVSWIRAQGEDSTFIADHYADPTDVQITFPEEKQNLIYIYLESMETTYADVASGGARSANLIPALTRIAQENEDFSGDSPLLGGGRVVGASSWTMAAMFAHTAGLPLKISVDGNSMDQQTSFFPGITTLGDILEDEGYQQTLLVGSNASFGGRRLYFTDHGNYAMRDLIYAQTNGWVPVGYHVFWGFEDKKLFAFAKEELTRMSAQDAPFNLTLLTVDTHFEDGYLCDLCQDGYGSDKYANVIACADCQVASFLDWVQNQPFYENTTVVIVGDHLTMDSNFCRDVEDSYDRRVYTAFINAAAQPANPTLRRAYTTYDLFPTTLAALGAQIEGDYLGLGANLYSTQPTLLEKYGENALKEELSRASRFMEEKAQLLIAEFTDYQPVANTLSLHIEGLQQFDDRAVTVEWSSLSETRTLCTVSSQGKITLDVSFSLPENMDHMQTIAAYWVDKNGDRFALCELSGHPLKSITDAETYLKVLAQLQDCSILMAVKDEASQDITPSIVAAMHALGLQEDLTNQYRASYYAVITADDVEEKLGYKPLKKNSKLPDGVSYRLMSSGHDAGNRVSILIDGEEYALDTRGLNIAVYSHTYDAVIDTLCLDLHEDCDLKR